MVMARAMIASRAARSVQRPMDHQAITPVWASLIKSRPWYVPAESEPWGSMSVITKPSSVQRSGIVWLLISCGIAAGGGRDRPQRAPRRAVYRRHGLLPRAPHALQQTQAVQKTGQFSVYPALRITLVPSTVAHTRSFCAMEHAQPVHVIHIFATLSTSANSFLCLAARLPASPSGFRTALALHCHAG